SPGERSLGGADRAEQVGVDAFDRCVGHALLDVCRVSEDTDQSCSATPGTATIDATSATVTPARASWAGTPTGTGPPAAGPRSAARSGKPTQTPAPSTSRPATKKTESIRPKWMPATFASRPRSEVLAR